MEILLLIGRIIFGAFFITSGINHFTNAKMMSGYAGSKGLPAPGLAVIATGVILLAGGVSVILGILPVIGLALLIVFLIPTSFIMHDFWTVEDPQQRMGEQVNFMKNMALAGAALALMYGATDWPLSLM